MILNEENAIVQHFSTLYPTFAINYVFPLHFIIEC